jgi:hypothetical protein
LGPLEASTVLHAAKALGFGSRGPFILLSGLGLSAASTLKAASVLHAAKALKDYCYGLL